ncbi:MAG TPA: hypothetical protein VGQ56_12540 [Gemmatimonadaceae bacterium]|nr:hypothetical protein [Gemmatimonadaceae bacterium]
MRKLMKWTVASTAFVAVACGKGNTPTTAMSDDLKRDLKLASQTQNMQISPDEVAPQNHQELALKPKRAPSGPKVIRTEHPTVRASAAPAEAAEIKSDIPQVQVMASAPAPSETPAPDAPPMARPAPVPAQGYPSTARIPASNGGMGGVLGGILGAVIRGGVVGDDDHCDPRGGRRGGRPVGGDVYLPIGGSIIRPMIGGSGRRGR